MSSQKRPENSDSILKEALLKGDAAFWEKLAARTAACTAPDDLAFLSRLRREATQRKIAKPSAKAKRKIAFVGGYTLFPFHELVEHFCVMAGIDCAVFVGEYDNYTQEILDPKSALCRFAPDILIVLPAAHRCHYSGALSDDTDTVDAAALQCARDLVTLYNTAQKNTGALLIASNYLPPSHRALGSLEGVVPGSETVFRRKVNAHLASQLPAGAILFDLEHLSAEIGKRNARDERAFFESKQFGSAEFIAAAAKECSILVEQTTRAPRKVLALDLDNTLWGGTVGDLGADGIELGDTSARGQAFKEFQRTIKRLKDRGILLCIASKNSHDLAMEAFRENSEMVLKEEDFSAIRANWAPKPENLRQMATELNVGLDSFVFVDDSPAEIEMMRQYAPEVACIALSDDPAEHVARLLESRLFDPKEITAEDERRTELYRAEKKRIALQSTAVDMKTYLAGLGMQAQVKPFTPSDLPRIAQLVNKSNQFNLTTIRRAQHELEKIAGDTHHRTLCVRLSDRFGDHGLIGAVILTISGKTAKLDTWIMSCRVLQRGVEQMTLNAIAEIAAEAGAKELLGAYLPTKKNGIVKDLYPTLGFKPAGKPGEYKLDLTKYEPFQHFIEIESERPKRRAGR